MVLLDSSAWIQLLNKEKASFELLQRVVICPPIIQEILQGIEDDLTHKKLKDGLLALPQISAPVDLDLYIEASQIYRIARRKGITVRSSVDCLIAAIAIRHSLTVVHQDRDFDRISQFTNLKVNSLQDFLTLV